MDGSLERASFTASERFAVVVQERTGRVAQSQKNVGVKMHSRFGRPKSRAHGDLRRDDPASKRQMTHAKTFIIQFLLNPYYNFDRVAGCPA